MSTPKAADWCADFGSVAICGTEMHEVSRKSEGVKWCFRCRSRHEFWWVVEAPAGLSYYGPSAHMEGVGRFCTDLFPGWVRQAVEE